MDSVAIAVQGLHYAYADGTRALDGVSFAVGHGESLAVIGGNGAGKSTLLMHLNGTLLPASGVARVAGIPVGRETLRQVRQMVGMVFQNPDDQLFMPTVREDVAFGPVNMGLAESEVDSRVARALDMVGAGGLEHKAPHHLSGGEKRAVSIATVLSMEPDILVLDEPGTGLDPRSRRRLINLLGELPQTLVMATHDLDMALDTCSHCLILKQGRVEAFGRTAELFRNAELLASCHLEQPWRLSREGGLS